MQLLSAISQGSGLEGYSEPLLALRYQVALQSAPLALLPEIGFEHL